MSESRPKPTIFAAAADFRAWLADNHATATELWVGYYKKGTGKSSMSYAEAVNEALCYGWIDGLTKSFGEFYANRFTPRRKGSNWSAINIAEIGALKEAGRMEPAGLSAFERRDKRKDAVYSYERPMHELTAAMAKRLRASTAAWSYWQAETPSYGRDTVAWLLDAKREETRERRLDELIADSAAGRRVKPLR